MEPPTHRLSPRLIGRIDIDAEFVGLTAYDYLVREFGVSGPDDSVLAIQAISPAMGDQAVIAGMAVTPNRDRDRTYVFLFMMPASSGVEVEPALPSRGGARVSPELVLDALGTIGVTDVNCEAVLDVQRSDVVPLLNLPLRIGRGRRPIEVEGIRVRPRRSALIIDPQVTLDASDDGYRITATFSVKERLSSALLVRSLTRAQSLFREVISLPGGNR